jgi:hypothetical protein
MTSDSFVNPSYKSKMLVNIPAIELVSFSTTHKVEEKVTEVVLNTNTMTRTYIEIVCFIGLF